ncbi:MAG TPA: hypothetical protein V6D27_00190, partial [Vampirovibrionales bacterium]
VSRVWTGLESQLYLLSKLLYLANWEMQTILMGFKNSSGDIGLDLFSEPRYSWSGDALLGIEPLLCDRTIPRLPTFFGQLNDFSGCTIA